MSIWYKLALFCSVFPLLTGLTILLLWWNAPSQSLEYAGLINIYSGVLLFVGGLVFLLIHHLSMRNSNPSKSITLPLSLLLLNFPIALGCVYAVSYKYSQSTITIHNLSPHTVEEITIQQSDGWVHDIKDVSSGARYKESMHFKYESDVTYSLKLNEQRLSGVLFGYVTPSLGSHGVVTVDAAGKIMIEETF